MRFQRAWFLWLVPLLALMLLLHLLQHAGVDVVGALANIYAKTWTGQIYRLLSAPLVHTSWSHLASNAIDMFIAWLVATQFFRPFRVAIAACVAAICSQLLPLLIWRTGLLPLEDTLSGASGIVYGLGYLDIRCLYRNSSTSNGRAFALSLAIIGVFSLFLQALDNWSQPSCHLAGVVALAFVVETGLLRECEEVRLWAAGSSHGNGTAPNEESRSVREAYPS